MVLYICNRCKKQFNHLGNYNAHINRKKTCQDVNKNNNIINSNNQDDIINEKNIKNNENTFCIQLNTFDYQADTFDYKNDELKLALNTFDYEANTSEHVKSKRIPQIINNDIFMNNEIDNKKIVKKYKCEYCKKVYNRKDNLHAHFKKCKVKNDKIKKMEEENAELKKKIEENEKLNKKQLVELKPNGQVAKYIVENYKDAPPVRYDNYKLSEEDIQTMMHCDTINGLCEIIDSPKNILNDFEEIQHICQYCNKIYKHKYHLVRHMKTCKKKNIEDENGKLQKIEKDMMELKKNIEEYKDTNIVRLMNLRNKIDDNTAHIIELKNLFNKIMNYLEENTINNSFDINKFM